MNFGEMLVVALLKGLVFVGLPGGPVFGALCFQCRGTRVQSLVRELGSHLPFGMAKK